MKPYFVWAAEVIRQGKQTMKIYQIVGDLSSNLSSENYPVVPLCDNCIKKHSDSGRLVQEISDFDPMYGDTCYFCGKSIEDELLEKTLRNGCRRAG